MRRFIILIFLFAFLTVLIYPIYLFVFGSIPGITLPNLTYNLGSAGHLHSRLQEVKGYKDVDILFLGSSHAYRGFDVRVFEKYGFYTFNLGSSSQTPIQTQLLLNRYLNKLNPKLIIYAISSGPFTSDGVESAIDIISNDKNDRFSLKMAMKINHLKVYNTLIYGSIRDILNLNSSFSQQIHLGDDTYISGGYVEINTERSYNEYKIQADESKKEQEEKYRQYQWDAFNKIISNFKNRNINYILVCTPVADTINIEFDNKIKQYGDYYNFNDIFDFSDDLFYDSNHLKQEGAEIFSASVADFVVSLNILSKSE
ncbi:MAG: hypothetical protein LBU88_08360 [Treponema sp.]|jgi:hypothetical protein|nr:hypothetical protein [Treponema sp.]